jgi:hypothetical protein
MPRNWARPTPVLAVAVVLFAASASVALTARCTTAPAQVQRPADPQQRICKRDYLVGADICKTRREWENAAARGIEF